MDPILSAGFILLGWLLGLLSPRLVEKLQRPHRRKELKGSLFIELEELRVKLAGGLFVVASYERTVDRELLLFLEPILTSDIAYEESKVYRDALPAMLKASDEEIAAHQQTKAEAPIGTFTKFSLPFLSSQLPSLHLFSPEFQRIALKILSRITVINEGIEVAAYHHKKTFEPLSSENHAIVRHNYNLAVNRVGVYSRSLILDINRLFSLK